MHRTSLFAASALCALAAVATPARAAPAIAFSIEAGPLHSALLTYAAQSRRQILFQPGQVAGRRARR